MTSRPTVMAFLLLAAAMVEAATPFPSPLFASSWPMDRRYRTSPLRSGAAVAVAVTAAVDPIDNVLLAADEAAVRFLFADDHAPLPYNVTVLWVSDMCSLSCASM